MGNRKTRRPDAETRENIERELLSGRSPGDVKADFPTVDGRIIGGIFKKVQSSPSNGSESAAPAGQESQADPAAMGYTPAGNATTPGGAGFAPPQRISFSVERTSPPDGLLGTWDRVLSPDEIGRAFGAGRYRCSYTNGRRTDAYELPVSETYGAPKMPNPSGNLDPRLDAIRAFARGNPSAVFGNSFGLQPEMGHGTFAFLESLRKDQERQHSQHVADADARHSREMERIHAEAELREKERDRFQTKLMELFELRQQMLADGIKAQRESLEEQAKLQDRQLKQHLEHAHEVIELQKKLQLGGTMTSVLGEARLLGEQIVKAIKEATAARQPSGHFEADPAGNVTAIPVSAPRPEPADISGLSSPSDDIAQYFRDPNLRSILTEWVRHVEHQVPPSSVGALIIDGMSHENPSIRRGTKSFETFMRTRDWDEMLEALGPHLTDSERKVFQTEAAANYYRGLRQIVAEEVDAYWEAVAARAAAKRELLAPADAEAIADANGETVPPAHPENEKASEVSPS